jgi:hypothetical protein
MRSALPRSTKTREKEVVADLGEFAKGNPWSRVEKRAGNITILSPWNDSTLVLSIGKEDRPYLPSLNGLVLPERFNAIFHVRGGSLEFIFNSLFDKKDPFPSDPFDFQFQGRCFKCSYALPSPELLFLARVYRPVQTGVDSSFRNLDDLQTLQHAKEFPKSIRSDWQSLKAISFFVGGLEKYEEDFVVLLSKHLNFYMGYFERQSPMVQILSVMSPPEEEDELPLQKSLPSAINATELDPFLLDLSLAAREGQIRLRFLYYYQMLEYSAYYWVEDAVKTAICRVLKAPDLQAKMDDYFPKLIEALSPARQQDEHKIRRVIESRVEPHAVWNQVKQDLAYFSSQHQFDGGFILEPVLSKDSTEDAFVKMWTPKILDTIRGIRNSLVHARENRTQAVIFPTVGNDRLLRPWLPVIRLIAEQVMLFEP